MSAATLHARPRAVAFECVCLAIGCAAFLVMGAYRLDASTPFVFVEAPLSVDYSLGLRAAPATTLVLLLCFTAASPLLFKNFINALGYLDVYGLCALLTLLLMPVSPALRRQRTGRCSSSPPIGRAG